MLHIFSDICICWANGKRFGAIIIGKDEPYMIEMGDGPPSYLELECHAVALRRAREKYPDHFYILHTDINAAQFERISESDKFIAKFGNPFEGVNVMHDARYHKPYKKCHAYSRIFCDINGTKHPFKLNYKEPIPAI